MLQNAVLLDSIVTEPSSKMDKTATFMHHLYCPVRVGNNYGIAKLYVTENIGDEHKFYLTKIKMESNDSIRQSKNSGSNSSLDSTISIAQIYDFVKNHNAEFEADSEHPTDFSPKPVNKALLNEDGTPKVVYHGTSNDFYAFDKSKIKIDNLGRGFYFVDKEEIAKSYAQRRTEERGGKERVIEAFLK